MESYFGFVVLVSFAAITAGGMVALSHWLGPRREGRIHDMQELLSRSTTPPKR